MLPTLWGQFEEVLFSVHCAPMHKERFIKAWLGELDVELAWPPRNPDLNPIKLLWDELERRL